MLCVFGALGAVFAPGCSDQGEGARCDFKNGNDDCASGLVCISVPGKSTLNTNSYRCCPQTITSSTDPECQASSSGEDAAPPTNEAGTPDAQPDADSGPQPDAQPPTDAPSDATDAADADAK